MRIRTLLLTVAASNNLHLLALLILCGCRPVHPAEAPGFVPIDAVAELVAKSPVPVYLPTRLRGIGIEWTIHEVTETGYTVSYYYSQDPSNASFAGLVSGSSLVGESPPGSSDVRLDSGAHARFRPVNCGGSCAPANLWWQMGGAEYHLQLKLPSDLGEDAQRAAIVGMANSMVLLR